MSGVLLDVVDSKNQSSVFHALYQPFFNKFQNQNLHSIVNSKQSFQNLQLQKFRAREWLEDEYKPNMKTQKGKRPHFQKKNYYISTMM